MNNDLQELQRKAEATFWGYVGFQMERLTPTSATISLQIKPEHLNLLGIVHGGVLMTMMDNAMGLVILQEKGQRTVTATMNTHFLSNHSNGTIYCIAELLHRTKRTITMKALIYDEAGEQLAYATGSYRLIQ